MVQVNLKLPTFNPLFLSRPKKYITALELDGVLKKMIYNRVNWEWISNRRSINVNNMNKYQICKAESNSINWNKYNYYKKTVMDKCQ